MPTMNGKQAAAKIRALGYKRRLVGVTGSASERSKLNFTQAGLDSIIVKPFQKQSLMSELLLCCE